MKNRALLIAAVLTAVSVSIPGDSFGRTEDLSSYQEPVVVRGTGSVVVNPPSPVVVAPQGLTPLEVSNLEQQYRYTVRNKESILTPFVGSESVSETGDALALKTSEQEKLYRYFAVADKFYKSGRIEEAIEILQYIADKSPDDRYVRNYLKRARSEEAQRNKRWPCKSDGQSRLLKKQAIRDLLKDGIDYYKQKRFDLALLKFNDVLASDPNNARARSYYNKLKEHYAKEVRVSDMVNVYESGSRQQREAGKTLEAEKLLDKESSAALKAATALLDAKDPAGESEIAGNPAAGVAKKLLDEEQLQSIVIEKKMNVLMDEADLGNEIEDIVTRSKEEDRRRDLYTLGPGDIIQIIVRDHPELSGEVTVRVNGDVVLPLVSDSIKLDGLTVEEAAAKITEAMKRYVRNPSATVVITAYKSKKFYIIDEIGCTPFPITRANLTLRDALFVADWGYGRALGRVMIMKPGKLHASIRKVDAFDLIYRGNLAKNVRIDNGDVIYIPMTVAAKITNTVSDALSPVGAWFNMQNQWINLKFNSQDGWKNLGRIPRTQAEQGLWQAPSGSGTATIAVTTQSQGQAPQ
jgi:protein involved in polysaccharide export with SLBB domain